jgi:tetratricopeptide (TPR) repeat protein
MASIIPGYEYDIFISYRQKDNKGDRWVSEFVESLKTELESTFKEEISVYFDINPHDGLLETHDVDASLKEKLKCLIFIPIISRTYCDPKSFAWEHEFKAFVEMASQDQFGLKIKLPNGNIASRALPLRIHDLDNADIKLCESLLGGVLRGIEFIYKESGFNRPLKPDDDEKINLLRTKYRNQITKVALAVKEIIQGIKAEPVPVLRVRTSPKEPLENYRKEYDEGRQEKPLKSGRIKLLSGILMIAILIVAAIFSYPKIFKNDTLEKLRSSGERISVVVMPFQNLTNDTIWNIWQNGIQEILNNTLSNSEEILVRQTESVNSLIHSKEPANYASITPAFAGKISQKLEANIFVFGNIIQDGPAIRISAQLVDSRTEEALKSFQMDGIREEKILPIIDSLSVQVLKFLKITILKKEVPAYMKPLVHANSPEAYRYYIYGSNAFNKRDYQTARNWFLQSIAIDSNFFYTTTLLAGAYDHMHMYEEAKHWILKAYQKRNLMPLQQKLWVSAAWALFFESPYETIKYLRQLVEIDNLNPVTHIELGAKYSYVYQYDKAIPELERGLNIYKKWALKPEWVYDYTLLGAAYHKTGQYKKEEKLYKKAEQDFPDDPELINRQAILSLSTGNTGAADQYIEKYTLILKANSVSEADITTMLAYIYYLAGIPERAEKYFRQSLASQPDNPYKPNDLAWFLIDTGRNLNEGLELIEKALVLSTDNYEFLETKGWGLYKYGKYQEALNVLQKSWDLRRKYARYNHDAFLHLEEVKKAVANQK